MTSNKTKFSFFLKFIDCHLSKIYLQSESVVLFESKLSIFYFKNIRIFIQQKTRSLKIATPGFQNYKKT